MSTKNSVLDRYPDYEVVIGIEVHVQLKTKSKIFCSCSNAKDTEQPNSTVCHICMGHPGVLPVLNEEVICSAVKAGLSINCDIAPVSYFDRKHYFYPDLPKGYQITQQYKPICLNGFVPIRLENGEIKKIHLSRIHIEEDAGKNVHASSGESFVDLNRAGTPLLEIVSLPDISSSYEARAYLKMLRSIVQTIDICTGNMEEGAFRADTNISVRKKGQTALGTKCELKNINSFKFIGDAIEYEIERQIETLLSGAKISQETRLWDTKQKITKVMRSKEQAADYRYFPEPDLLPVFVTEEYKQEIKAALPELPYDKFDRFMKEFGLSAYETTIFLDDEPLASYFEHARKFTASKTLVNWILRDVMSLVKETGQSYEKLAITPKRLAKIVEYIDDNTITAHIGRQLFEKVLETNQDPEVLITSMQLPKQTSSSDLEALVAELIAQFPGQAADYKAGKTKLLGFFVGKVMEKTKGSVNPATITSAVKKKLE